jgi:hypothetical protein
MPVAGAVTHRVTGENRSACAVIEQRPAGRPVARNSPLSPAVTCCTAVPQVISTVALLMAPP